MDDDPPKKRPDDLRSSGQIKPPDATLAQSPQDCNLMLLALCAHHRDSGSSRTSFDAVLALAQHFGRVRAASAGDKPRARREPQATSDARRMAGYLARIASIQEKLVRTVIGHPRSAGLLLRAVEAWLRAGQRLEFVLRARRDDE